MSQAFALNHKLLECEYYNKSSCAHDDCKTTQKITCEDLEPEKPSHCFVLWSTNNQTNKMEVTLKGCFSNNVACNQSECIDYSSVRNKNLNFCCCKTDMCNTDHKWIPTSTEAIDIATTPPKEDESILLPIILVVIITVISCATVIGIYCYRQKKHAMFNEVPQIEPEVTGSSSCLALRKIQLHEEKARGRFGTVWRATMKTDEVAVKIFPMQDKQSWLAEQDIYKLPRMKHLNILEFIGAEKRFDSLKNEFWLISTYHKHGSLCDYLKAHTVTWPELCKIAESMARGLMHLHEEIPAIKTDGLKPAIAHRDFKSKNVLLKNDLTACIADFGLALVFTPGRPCGEDHGQVGTRRYMAPEVLEGAITFTRDSFLRIDVYACGLVLWELVSRCTGHNGTAKEFRLPFENEVCFLLNYLIQIFKTIIS